MIPVKGVAMFEVQHVGIPADNLLDTIKWYGHLGFSPVYQTILENDIEVAFIDVSGVLLEFYTAPVQKPENPVIASLSIDSQVLSGSYEGPSGEVINFENEGSGGLIMIELNSSSFERTANDLKRHGFSGSERLYTNGLVSFQIRDVPERSVSPGAMNHIAFNEPLLKKRHEKIVSSDIPVVEGVNYLPFFENGVVYFVTENHDGLRLEYNQIL